MDINTFNFLVIVYAIGVLVYGYYYGLRHKVVRLSVLHWAAFWIGIWKTPYKWTLVVFIILIVFYNFFYEII